MIPMRNSTVRRSRVEQCFRSQTYHRPYADRHLEFISPPITLYYWENSNARIYKR